MVACCQRDTRELYLICVDDNVVSEESVWMPSNDDLPAGFLPYEREHIRWHARRNRRPRPA